MEGIRIITIEDIITKIPEDKFDLFLEEMNAGLKQTKAVYELATAIGETVGVKPPTLTEGFLWSDDGQNEITTTLTANDDTEEQVSFTQKRRNK